MDILLSRATYVLKKNKSDLNRKKIHRLYTLKPRNLEPLQAP
jgi:hypothetical protein